MTYPVKHGTWVTSNGACIQVLPDKTMHLRARCAPVGDRRFVRPQDWGTSVATVRGL
jgi:hypothetical protein